MAFAPVVVDTDIFLLILRYFFPSAVNLVTIVCAINEFRDVGSLSLYSVHLRTLYSQVFRNFPKVKAGTQELVFRSLTYALGLPHVLEVY